jgi:hypothetical protein
MSEKRTVFIGAKEYTANDGTVFQPGSIIEVNAEEAQHIVSQKLGYVGYRGHPRVERAIADPFEARTVPAPEVEVVPAEPAEAPTKKASKAKKATEE